MASPITTRPPVPIAIGAGTTGTEEGRTFHQSRLALYGRWMFLVSGAFLAFFSVLRAVYGLGVSRGVLFHALGTVVAGLVWTVGAGTRMSPATMYAVDGVATWLTCASFALMAHAYAGEAAAIGLDPAPTAFVGLLAVSYVLLARAIALPSTAGRTAVIGASATVPLLIASWGIASSQPPSPSVVGMLIVDVISWSIGAVAMSTVASRVIFGLRADLARSRRLGQYTLGDKIGEGGMGVVYRAHHAMLRRPTAIKLLKPEKAGADNILRFEREVQLTASLTHPNTVAIFDYGRTVDGTFYYAMEYLDGVNLDDLVRADGPQPPGRVIHILRQVSGALAEAHLIGLVHRDIKPANIILCERGGLPDVAKVVDFGLVKPFRASDTRLTVEVTREETLIGTPHYMAPESASGSGEIDARSDLYSLGAVGYLLLTGSTPFDGRSSVEVLSHHLRTPPDPPSRRLGRPLPGELEQIILQCLAKVPDDRPSSARMLGARLAQLRSCDDWSDDDAARWWLQFRRRASRPAIEAAGTGVPRAHEPRLKST
jgi:serine/threonine-protein kinase